jgi:hypothetical protein
MENFEMKSGRQENVVRHAGKMKSGQIKESENKETGVW